MYSQLSPPGETEMLMRSNLMPGAFRVAAPKAVRKDLFRSAAIEAGGKRGVVSNRIQAVEGLDENIPGQVLRGCHISRDFQAQGVDSSGMRLEESEKSVPFALLGAL